MSAADPKDYRSLGEILRDARESQDKSIEDVSDITKISPKVLMALEADDLDQVADPVYARSFVRTLAEALSLDSSWLLTKLEHASAAQKPAPVPAGAEPRDDTTWHIEDVRIQKVTTPPPRSFPKLAVGVIVGAVLAAAAFWLIQRNSGSSGASDTSQTPAVSRQAELTGAPSLPAAAQEGAAEEEAEAGEDAGVAERPSMPPASSPAVAAPEPSAPSSPPVTAAEPASTPADAAGDDRPDAGEDPTTGAATPSPNDASSRSAPAAEEEVVVDEERSGLPSIVRPPEVTEQPIMKLVVTAVEKVDVVVAADGAGRRLRTLAEGESWTVEARDHFSLEISDPQRVLVELDGIHRDPPAGLTGEWILYPNPSPR